MDKVMSEEKELNLPKDLSKDAVLIIARVYGVLGSIRNCKDCLDFGKYRFLMISETDKVIKELKKKYSDKLDDAYKLVKALNKAEKKLKAHEKCWDELKFRIKRYETQGYDNVYISVFKEVMKELEQDKPIEQSEDGKVKARATSQEK